MNQCPKCGNEVRENSKFCEDCGEKLIKDNDNSSKVPVTKLVVTRGGVLGKEFIIDSEVMNIGRWDPDGGAFPEIDLTNDDPEAKISRKHARILKKGDKYYIEDVGSLNGTYINRGARLVPGEPQEIKNNDEIIMGKTFFKFIIE